MTISPSIESTPGSEGKRAVKQRYRYFEEAPETISLPASELLKRIPAEYCLPAEGDAQADRNLEIPCLELFSGNTPHLSLVHLQGLAPDLIRIPDGTDSALRLSLPAGWLALHYRMIHRREELPPESGSISEPEEQSQKEAINLTVLPEGSHPSVQFEEIKNESAAPDDLLRKETNAVGVNPLKEAEQISLIDKEPVEKEKRRGFFASLPIFQRHEKPKTVSTTEQPIEPVTQELKPVPASFEPRNAAIDKVELLEVKERKKGGEPEAVKKLAPVEEKALTLERLWKLDPTDQLADSTALQALFMTEEKLTLERVLALAGQLPGLKACVLAHGDQVACASNTPAGIDLPALSKQATIMLSQIRDSSAQMGLGSVPAITLHAEQGILSFLYHGELCLLVLHADRGFVPGVRERLQEMLGHLTSAKALPGGASAQSSLPI